MTIGVLTEAEMVELRALMDAASAGLVMGGDYIGAMLAAAPRLLATIAARDEVIARLREIAKAVAAIGMGMTDGLGRYCLMCGASADYDYPDVPGDDDAALTEYERISAEREAACIAAIEHAADCAWIAARKLAGGVS